MKLKTVTKFVAITSLVVALFHIATMIRSLAELSSGHMKWEDNWLYLISMPVYFVWNIALTVFFFTLAARQKDS
jgi:hypothetical protein